jgi:hypothetical protein
MKQEGGEINEADAVINEDLYSADFQSPIANQKQDALKYAHLSYGAYIAAEKDGAIDQLKLQGWEVEWVYERAAIGYRAVLFYNPNTQERVMSYAGTDDFPDVITDIVQGTVGGSQQYNYAVLDAQDARVQFGPIDHFTGHSLGGGMASLAAIANRKRATTFNAAGLNIWTAGSWGLNLDSANILIDAYRVRGEFLSTIQDGSPIWMAFAPLPGWGSLGVALFGLAGATMPNGVGKAYWIPETNSNMFLRHKMLTDVIPGLMKA